MTEADNVRDRILNYPVQPGDLFSAEVSCTGNNRFTLTIANPTRNVAFSSKEHRQKQVISALPGIARAA